MIALWLFGVTAMVHGFDETGYLADMTTNQASTMLKDRIFFGRAETTNATIS